MSTVSAWTREGCDTRTPFRRRATITSADPVEILTVVARWAKEARDEGLRVGLAEAGAIVCAEPHTGHVRAVFIHADEPDEATPELAADVAAAIAWGIRLEPSTRGRTDQ